MILRTLALLLLALPASAADDCAKNADACSGGGRPQSPFAQASLSEVRPAAAADRKKPALKPAPAPAPAAKEPARAEASTAAPAAAADPLPSGRQMSSPLWLVFVGGSLAGLYFYLGAGRKRGRRK